jgi:hypothetical protein
MKVFLPLVAAALFMVAAPANAQNNAYDSLASSISKAKKEIDNFRPKFGIKAGYNIAKVKGSTPSYSPDNENGFMIGAFYSTPSKGVGYRSELVFSRQGFSFDESGKMQEVQQDYIYMPNFTTFTIAQKVQLQAGAQIGYLLNAQKKSSSGSESDVEDYMNRLDYGFAGGVEVYPFKGLLVGARYNVSLGSVYKQYESAGSSPLPIGYPFPFTPNDIKGKNAVVQFFAGYRF